MPALEVTIGGLDAALRDLGAVPALVEAVAKDSVLTVAKKTKGEASRLTRQTYALTEQDLDPFITLRAATTPRGGASVTLLARPLPLSVFRPTVKMQTFTLTSSKGRTFTRKLPTVYVKRFKRGAAKQLKPYFPLHQRSSGALSSSDRAVRRVGSPGNFVFNARGAASDKLTGVRYYTFPKAFLARIRQKLVAYVGEQGSLELRGALRKNFRGMRVLRGPR